MEKEYSTLILSGGSIKSFLTIGAIQSLTDMHLLQNITKYIGTSAGSIISYLLLVGYTAIEMMIYVSTHSMLQKISNNIDILNGLNGNGVISFTHIQEILEKMTIEKLGYYPTLLDLYKLTKKKLICITFNLTKDKIEFLSHETYPDLPCITALRMSCNLPIIFGHFKYYDSYFVDGGLTLNIGLDNFILDGENVIALNIDNKVTFDIHSNMLEYFYHILEIPIRHMNKLLIDAFSKKENITIIQLSDANTTNKIYDFNLKISQKFDMFSIGYNLVKQYFEKNYKNNLAPNFEK